MVVTHEFYLKYPLQFAYKDEIWGIHSAESSNELSDLHTTQSPGSEVKWGARSSGQWVAISMFV